MATPDFPIDDAFAHLCTRVFRIQTAWTAEDGNEVFRCGTGFAAAKLPNGKFIVATARHVLDVPEDRMVNWVVQQFDHRSNLVREARYGTHKELKGAVPYRRHKKFDVGVFPLLNQKPDGTPFSPPDEMPLPLIPEQLMDGTGTRVGWIGFPTQVESFLGRPQLCYCEGVIASLVNVGDQHLYIVDGHNSRGFSGGPVFSWDPDPQQFRVTGIVSGYFAEQDLPGFCSFEPVNHVRFYLNWWNTQLGEGEIGLA